ncbi:MAG TPA: 3-deoxy-7-phosphoheptulonate synthase class II [Acidimicrobiales bacterium]|jgi:3-deoxy-7-phosphoheptulonate synthase|nr:3-deoxy-7-phosphoheptulonate synthase class II [Acidimicrobiales bacterium]
METASGSSTAWHPASWRQFPATQLPEWPDPAVTLEVYEKLRALPPLVFAGEAERLKRALALVGQGKAFLLQAGDCAESFEDFTANSIRDKLKVILQMAVVLTYGSGVPVLKVGRIAGQFAKPRSSPIERVGDIDLPVFRGHIVNDDIPVPSARVPDPLRMLQAYHQSCSTLNLLRAFTKGGFADLSQVHSWNQEFVAASAEGRRYDAVAEEIDRALSFMRACGVDLSADSPIHQVDLFTSHEALLLDYEECLTRQDSLSGRFYDCSAHMLWVGERTRQVDGAHVEFASGIHNPVAVKLGPSTDPGDVLALCERLNPGRLPGRLTLISRMGANQVRACLPPLLRAVSNSDHPVTWACDPMHGNTFTSDTGRKTRHFDDVLGEIQGYFDVHRSFGTWPGGVHVELTGDNVTECLGGIGDILEEHLPLRYTTACDPRLNAGQSIDLAFRVAELLRDG